VSPTARRGPRRPPVERVRAKLADAVGPDRAGLLPTGYQRLGRVLMVRWPESLRPQFPLLAEAFQRELGVVTVLRYTGPMKGELRVPAVETLSGTETETEVVEHGIRWRFDAARVMFAAGNRAERERVGRLTRPGEVVADLFAGIGYFAIPAAKIGRADRVWAIDRNPVSVHYLAENARRNGVADRLTIETGDNRHDSLPAGIADRVFLGYLPSAVPWIDRGIRALRPEGGWLHVHLVTDARGGLYEGERRVAAAVTDRGASLLAAPRAREVKPYGPGRVHVVVDVRVGPAQT
jgi:tRNA wybutosine-synthesizing protein 2